MRKKGRRVRSVRQRDGRHERKRQTREEVRQRDGRYERKRQTHRGQPARTRTHIKRKQGEVFLKNLRLKRKKFSELKQDMIFSSEGVNNCPAQCRKKRLTPSVPLLKEKTLILNRRSLYQREKI